MRKIYLNIKQNIDNLLDGLFEIIPMKHFLIFDEFEIEILLCGSGLDKIENPIKDWQENTKYSNGYSKTSQIIIWFWEIVEDYGALSVAKLLQFGTYQSYIIYFFFEQSLELLHYLQKDLRQLNLILEFVNYFLKNKVLYLIESKSLIKDILIEIFFSLNRIDIPEYKTKLGLEKEMKRVLKI